MRMRLLKSGCVVAFAAVMAVSLLNQDGSSAAKEKESGPMLAHMVFFELKDKTPESRDKLLAACEKYLTDHPGVVYYSAGARGEEFVRDVNDQAFDVALHLVFENKAAHDTYATAPRHLQFIEEGKPLWSNVRVFDSYVK